MMHAAVLMKTDECASACGPSDTSRCYKNVSFCVGELCVCVFLCLSEILDSSLTTETLLSYNFLSPHLVSSLLCKGRTETASEEDVFTHLCLLDAANNAFTQIMNIELLH